LKVYTRSGDTGETSLLGGRRISKAALRIDCYGVVDELNANIGVLCDQVRIEPKVATLAEKLVREINALFSLGSFLATPQDKLEEYKMSAPSAAQVQRLEEEIDLWQSSLPKLENFILPTGHILVSTTHVSRTLARRAERKLTCLFDSEPDHTELKDAIKYINRLSDWFFVLARFIGMSVGAKEVVWVMGDHA